MNTNDNFSRAFSTNGEKKVVFGAIQKNSSTNIISNCNYSKFLQEKNSK